MDKYFPEGDKTSTFSIYGYLTAQTMVQVLKQCGNDLTRENVMRQAANLKNFELALLWQILAIDWRNWIPESDFQ
jgi:branched-chain amino acid transport system substrate-binding protein